MRITIYLLLGFCLLAAPMGLAQESDRIRQVFVRHAFRCFLGRNEKPGDAPTFQEAEKAYRESGGSFQARLVSLLSSESFLYRTVPTNGPQQ